MARERPQRLDRAVAAVFPDLPDPAGAIAAGMVTVNGFVVVNPASQVRADARVELVSPAPLRGEAKLRAAIEHFGVDLTGRVALDVGAAAGGFTRVILEKGARRVYACDAGHGQLLGSLRQDPRVVNLEATNVAGLDTENVPEAVEFISIDVSYLALGAAVAQLDHIAIAPGADLIGLVKPMFELRLANAPTDEPAVEEATRRASGAMAAAGWLVRAHMPSPVTGARGAREALVHARREA